VFPVRKFGKDAREMPPLQDSCLNAEIPGEIQVTVNSLAFQRWQIANVTHF